MIKSDTKMFKNIFLDKKPGCGRQGDIVIILALVIVFFFSDLKKYTGVNNIILFKKLF